MIEPTTLPAVAAHGSRRLPSVEVDSYNVQLKDNEDSQAIARVEARSKT